MTSPRFVGARGGGLRCALQGAIGCGALVAALAAAPSAVAADPPVALPSLDVAGYTGTWYQVALYPNVFQRQCVRDTTATYRSLPDGTIEVTNRCRQDDGSVSQVVGVARPPAGEATLAGNVLSPAKLEVRFAPRWLAWLPWVWAPYWVIQRADDGRYAVVAGPTREYLWVLSRTPILSAGDETAIRSRLAEQGFDVSRLQRHEHSPR